MSLGFDKNKGIEYPCDKCDLINVTFVNILSQIKFTLEDMFRQNIFGPFHDLYVCTNILDYLLKDFVGFFYIKKVLQYMSLALLIKKMFTKNVHFPQANTALGVSSSGFQ